MALASEYSWETRVWIAQKFLRVEEKKLEDPAMLVGRGLAPGLGSSLTAFMVVVFPPFSHVDVLVFNVVGQPKTRTSVPLLADGTGVKLGQSINVWWESMC